MEHEQEVDARFLAMMREGDQLCAYPLGTRVFKSTFEEGDRNPIGTSGTVTGSKRLEEFQEDCYLVAFDGDLHESFVRGSKISVFGDEVNIKKVVLVEFTPNPLILGAVHMAQSLQTREAMARAIQLIIYTYKLELPKEGSLSLEERAGRMRLVNYIHE